jgi:integrase
MANDTVSLMLYGKTDTGKWRYFPAASYENGKLMPGMAMVDNKPKEFDSFKYVLRSYDGRKTVYRPVGTKATDAYNQYFREFKKREAEQEAREAARKAGLKVVTREEGGQTVKKAAEQFLARLIKRRRMEAAQVYGHSLKLFQQALPNVVYLDQIDEDALLDFHAYLRKRGKRKRGNSERTISNRHGHIKSLLLFSGVTRDEIKKRVGDAPKYDKKVVVAYHADELSTLFAHAEESDRYIFGVLNLLLMTGIRDREGTHLTWSEVDFKRGHIKLAAKPGCRDCVECRKNDRGFRLKDREERIIQLHPELMTILRERRKEVPNSRFVFGDGNDRPHTKWLRMLKRTAREAGVNCGHCDGCRDYAQRPTEDGGCKHWTLHAFRRTYATKLLKQGANVKQIMQLLGHSDLDTTLRYLGAAEAEENADVVARIDWFKK